jgi:hypothetical protein
MTPTDAHPALSLDDLRRRFGGAVFGPADEGWDQARLAWNLAVDQHPAAVAVPENADDVAAAVTFARDAGLQVAVQGTGHNAGAYGDLATSLLIKTERMRKVSIDASAQTARVEAGVTWGEVVIPAAEHGLAALAGSSHDVGVVGYTLGGGVSWLARKHGLACDRVTAIEVVTADGQLRRATADVDADLFWALRGGGGNFGVVTAMEFNLIPLAEVYAGALFFPFERAEEVLDCWRRWTAGAPDEVTSIGRLLQVPPMPEVPEAIRGKSFTVVEAVYLGSEESGSDLLKPLRELGPLMDTFAMVPPTALLELHMDPPGPVPGKGDHQMLADLDAASVASLVEAAGPGSGSTMLSFEVRHLGGALAGRAEGSGSLGSLDGRYMTYGVGMLAAPDVEAPLAASLLRAREALDVVDNGGQYGCFAEREVDADTMYGERTLRRLRTIKDAVDPEGIMHGNHPIAAAM